MQSTTGSRKFRRIATEEAFSIPEVAGALREVSRAPGTSLDLMLVKTIYDAEAGTARANLRTRLIDLEEERLRDMDANGVDVHLLSLTAPGVQMFDADTATELAILANDRLAETIARHPTRFAGLASFAPHSPKRAAKEMERAIRQLKLNGFVVNSHTNGEYLDDPKFWALFEACEALGVPIYLHPTSPSKSMIAPFLAAGLDGAIYGFGVETGLHLLRIIVKGVFDRFPKLQIIVGHCGEALPFWLYRLDYMHAATVSSNRYAFMKPLKRKVSDYLRENVYITTSGVAWEPAIMFCRAVIGADRVMYAMDYPYQFVRQEVVTSDNLPLTAPEKKQFFQGNAERVFRL